MKKVNVTRLVLLVIGVSCFIFAARIYDSASKQQVHVKPSGQLIASAQARFHYVDLYQNGSRACIDAYSDSFLDIPHTYCFPTEAKLNSDSLEVHWMAASVPRKEVPPDSDSVALTRIIVKATETFYKTKRNSLPKSLKM